MTISLQQALKGNAIFSAVCGIELLAFGGMAADWLIATPGEFLGLSAAGWMRLLGAGLLLFALDVWLVARAAAPKRAFVLAITAADWAWVAGSVVLVLAVPALFTPLGIVAVLAVAAVTALCAVLQGRGLAARSGDHRPLSTQRVSLEK